VQALTTDRWPAEGASAPSSGWSWTCYSVRITRDAPEDELRGLIRHCEQDSSIGNTLQRSTRVHAAAIHVHGIA
jgi:hypothetical protein